MRLGSLVCLSSQLSACPFGHVRSLSTRERETNLNLAVSDTRRGAQRAPCLSVKERLQFGRFICFFLSSSARVFGAAWHERIPKQSAHVTPSRGLSGSSLLPGCEHYTPGCLLLYAVILLAGLRAPQRLRLAFSVGSPGASHTELLFVSSVRCVGMFFLPYKR